MGVVYFLAREDNHTLFEIGKFTEISTLFSDLGEGGLRRYAWFPRELPPVADLQIMIRVAIDDVKLSMDHDAYAAELARRITIFAGGQWICLLNDASSDDVLHDQYADDDDELRVVDSVYTSTWSTTGVTE